MIDLITEHMDIWTAAQAPKGNGGPGRGSNGNGQSPHGIKKLRELILELAVRGKLVPQDPKDEPVSVLLKQIAEEKKQLIKEGKIKKEKILPGVGDEEKPFELPKGWEWTRIGIISQINPRNEAADHLNVSFIPMSLISTSHTGEHGQEVKVWGEIKQGYTHFANGDVGVAKITPCFENSKAAVFSGLKNGIGAGTTELHIARPFGSTLSPHYVLLFLKSPKFLYTGESKMTGTAGQKRLPKDFFSGFPFPLPPIPEQQRIVSKVNELMTLCDQLEQQQTDSNDTHQTLVSTLLAALTSAADAKAFAQTWQRIADHFDTLFATEASIDQLRQTILQLAVMGKLVPQDPNDEPASALLERIAKDKKKLINEGKIKKEKLLPEVGEDEKPFELPKRWEWTRLGIISQINPRNEAADQLCVSFIPMPLISTSYTGEHGQEIKPWGEIKQGYTHFANGDIGVAKITPCFENSKAAVFSGLKNGIGAGTTELHIARPFGPTLSPQYVLLFLKSPKFLYTGESKMTGTAGQKRLPRDFFSGFPFPLPPLSEQHRIVTQVNELMTLCEKLKTRLNETQATQLQLADAIVEQATPRLISKDPTPSAQSPDRRGSQA